MSPLLATTLVCALILLLWIAWRLSSIDRRLARREARLDLPARSAGVTSVPLSSLPAAQPAGVPSGVVETLRSGNKIEAIKRYREATGVGLAELKDFVEGLGRRS